MNARKVIFSLTLASMLATPAFALAQLDPRGFNATLPTFTGIPPGNQSLIGIITNIVNALLAIAALVASIFVILGGVRYITSQGDEDAVASAKNTVLYSAVGIIVILLSAVLVNFVVNSIK